MRHLGCLPCMHSSLMEDAAPGRIGLLLPAATAGGGMSVPWATVPDRTGGARAQPDSRTTWMPPLSSWQRKLPRRFCLALNARSSSLVRMLRSGRLRSGFETKIILVLKVER